MRDDLMTFDAFVRVAVTMSIDEVSALIDVQAGKAGFRDLVNEAVEFSYSADPVAQFKEMMIADLIYRRSERIVGNHAADLADDADNRRSGVKRASRAKTAPPVSVEATKTPAPAVVKKTVAKKATPAAVVKPAVVKKASKAKERLTQLLPGGVVTAEIVTKQGTETIRLTQKAAITLKALQAAKGNPMPKAELFAAIVRLFGIETSQDGFRVNDQCHLLEAAGLATMSRIDGGGTAQYRSATERGMSVVLPAITRIG